MCVFFCEIKEGMEALPLILSLLPGVFRNTQLLAWKDMNLLLETRTRWDMCLHGMA